MRSFEYTDFEGNKKIQKQLGENSALPYITRRIEYFMPKETVEADKLKAMVASIEIDCKRDITPEEANKLVTTIKDYIIDEIDRLDKYYVSRTDKKKNQD